ncbi:MFS transporter [Nonomuraea guangzhouensis]|uniref:MFS transporter n=1 Tax=Nonomuraea guangzhouensis TaxID=1291555 RepID=A0ABW4GRB2_9ACTN|nr:MFS transporter [Nonomuraea guangzhouensis]
MTELDAITGARDRPAEDRMTSRHRLTLSLLLGAQFMLAVDFSVLNIAVPTIGSELGFELSNLQWIVTGFMLPAAGFTLLFGRVADLFGRRNLFLVGILVLGVASLVGGLAQSPSMLLAGRIGQGLATALATPAAMSLLTTSFPEGPLRRRALGLNGTLLTGGFALGSVLGGVLTELLSWRWAFLINLPVVVLILALGSRVLHDTSVRTRTRLDVPGAVTVTGALLSLVYGISATERSGWGDPAVIGCLALAGVLLVAFWFIESRSSHPLAPVSVLKRPTVRWGNCAGLLVISMPSAVVFQMTLYLQDVLGYKPLTAGLAFGGSSIAAIVGGLLAPRVIGAIGSKRTLVTALTVQGLGILALLTVDKGDAGLYIVLTAVAVAFFGHAMGLVSYTVIATSGLPDEEQGLATGLSTMSQQIALTLGTPVLAAVAAFGTHSADGVLTSIGDTLDGMHRAVLAAAVASLVVAALVATFFRPEAATRTP